MSRVGLMWLASYNTVISRRSSNSSWKKHQKQISWKHYYNWHISSKKLTPFITDSKRMLEWEDSRVTFSCKKECYCVTVYISSSGKVSWYICFFLVWTRKWKLRIQSSRFLFMIILLLLLKSHLSSYHQPLSSHPFIFMLLIIIFSSSFFHHHFFISFLSHHPLLYHLHLVWIYNFIFKTI